MARWYGKIGFAETKEVEPGIWTEAIVERTYYGDLNRAYFNLQHGDSLSTDLSIAHTISLVADPYADKNFPSMRYVEIKGTKWKINSIDLQYPRLILTLGGVYNGN